MGKERVVLEDQANSALFDGKRDDAFAADADVALAGLRQPGQKLQKCRLAAAGWPKQGDELSFTNGQ